ncbi:MAG TPA: spore coat protein CotJB [Desulfobacteria bacterium]|nr:spore coat protein CotJB [Desulfobacteria bacterium]
MSRKITQQASMLKEIMSHEFTAVELNLYLDTHPDDTQALAEYNHVSHMLRILKSAYEQCYGPLTNYGTSMAQCPWRWTDEPWPWQIEY